MIKHVIVQCVDSLFSSNFSQTIPKHNQDYRIKKWWAWSMQLSSYTCTREVAKHDRSVSVSSPCATPAWVLSKPPKCIYNSIVAQCTLNISFITLRLLRFVRLTWRQKRDKPRNNVQLKIWQSYISNFSWVTVSFYFLGQTSNFKLLS